MDYGKIISETAKIAKYVGPQQKTFVKFAGNAKSIINKQYLSQLAKGGSAPAVDRIATNTPGRILRMQDAKDAFVLGNRNGVALTEKTVMSQNPNIHLTTSDNFLERFRQMWPDINPTDILKQKAQRYNDLCYLFGKLNIK